MDNENARKRQARLAARAQAGARPAPDQPDDELTSGDAADVALQADDELDEAQAQQNASAEEARQAQLDAFAQALSRKKDAAIQARQQSGIEDIWREDEEFYEGIDDANRGESVTVKPRDLGGTGAPSVMAQPQTTGSTVFVNITRPYVDFSAGRAADMLLPTDDPNWDLRETPMPDIIAAMGSDKPLTPPPGMQLAPNAPSTIGQAAAQMVDEARKKVEKAKKRITDWLEEGQYSAEQRKLLKDAAKVGVALLKGPFPIKSVSRVLQRDQAGNVLGMEIQNKTVPTSKRISYWNFYPDYPACGDDIHRGNFTWERDYITARELRDLIGTVDDDGQPFYIESAIQQCLREGPQRKHIDDASYSVKDSEAFEIWYFHGVAEAEDLRAAGLNVDDDKVIPVMITMVNDRVIKAARSTLDTGDFPYDALVWQPREGHWAGIGVARQVRTPQRMVNAATRNMLDNAGLAAGPQIVVADGAIKPVDPTAPMSIAPRKLWKMGKDTNIDDVRKAFAAIEIPMLTDDLLKIIQYAQKLAEDCTGMPMLMQGQQGNASDTVGGMQILNNNSNTPLRMIAKQFDDQITIPHLLRYYEWLLIYGPEQDEKGEFIVAARGSSALFERDAQHQAILGMAQLIGNPAFNIDPKRWIVQYLKAQRLDPENFQYSPAEQAQLAQQAAQNPPPPDPKVQAAQIGAQARVQVAQIAAESKDKQIAADTDRDSVFAQNEAERTQADATAQEKELNTKLQLAYLQYANQRNISLDQLKAELAQTTMKLNTQKELSQMSAMMTLHQHHTPSAADLQAQHNRDPQVITPPTEPAGRAPNGEAWQA